MEYNSYNQPPRYDGATYEAALTSRVSQAMKAVYLKMTFGLLVTALVSFFLMQSPGYITYVLTHGWTMWAFVIAEFALVIGISSGIQKMSSGMATLLFYLFAAVNALMLSTILVFYSPDAIAKTFFITAGTFAAMSIYGYTTGADLTKAGRFLMMALIGLIIAMLVNIFAKSSTLDWIISIVGVLIFVGLTAWDTQQIKRLAQVIPASEHGRLATIGALNLYLDFINLFLYLLRIFGGGDRD